MHEITDIILEVQACNDIDTNRDVLFQSMHQYQLDQMEHIQAMHHMQQMMLEKMLYNQEDEDHYNHQMYNLS